MRWPRAISTFNLAVLLKLRFGLNLSQSARCYLFKKGSTQYKFQASPSRHMYKK